MPRLLASRPGHYLLLLTAAALLYLPNLGGPSLWDVDEGHNAEAAREMLESGNWIVPTFNFQLRVDKPALLYWLQIAAYRTFGVNEFAARLPSALAAALAALLAYELGRLLFGPTAGLLGALALASSLAVVAAAHFANPDALLHATTLLTFLVFWSGFRDGRRSWFLLTGAAMGLAVLAKGPVGLALPGAVIAVYLLLSRQLGRLLDRRLGWGVLAFVLVGLPWYVWVGLDTRAAFLRGFFLTHNVGRFLRPMESHGGPVYYYLLVLPVGLAPWSVFLGATVWDAARARRESDPTQMAGVLFLACWFTVYLGFFSLSSTKLPNYVLPAYAPVALLTGRFLDRWRCGVVEPSVWVTRLSVVLVALVGVLAAAGLLTASGRLAPELTRGRVVPGLEPWSLLGLVPLAGAGLAAWFLRQEQRGGFVAALGLTAVLFAGGLAVGASAVEGHKAPRALAVGQQVCRPEEEVRVACHRYYQPSLVFYCRREVRRLDDEKQALAFLSGAWPAYLFVPADVWDGLADRAPKHRVLGRQRDLYRGMDVVVVTNR